MSLFQMDPSTYEYLEPSMEQRDVMESARLAAKAYADAIEVLVPDGADKTFILRSHRTTAMWVNVAITRHTDGSPRV